MIQNGKGVRQCGVACGRTHGSAPTEGDEEPTELEILCDSEYQKSLHVRRRQDRGGPALRVKHLFGGGGGNRKGAIPQPHECHYLT